MRKGIRKRNRCRLCGNDAGVIGQRRDDQFFISEHFDMTIGTRLFTWLRGEYVGSDEQGNRYYQEKKAVEGRKRRRWVMYNGTVEASRVPPDWHGWLHYTVDTPPPEGGLPKKPWQKPHVPNLTGTANAYRPPGDILNAVPQAKPDSIYEPWQPN